LEKQILIAVDDSIYSKKAIEYAVRIGSVIKGLRYTLFNIQPMISEYLAYDAHLDVKARSALKDVVEKNHENSRRLLDGYRSGMIKKGIDEKHVDTISQTRIRGIAKDILDYGKQNICDALVLGRRGVGRLEEAFTGSISNTVIEHSSVTPVWAVAGDITSSKIMLAIDGSESALKAVDHLSFMIGGGNPDTKITLLHVTPRLRDYCTVDFDEEGDFIEHVIAEGDKQCVESFYVHAQQRFKEAGLKDSQIEIKEIKSNISVAKTIVDETRKENYSTVVVGRRGMDKSFFMGSVSRYILDKASNCAVWLVS